MTDDPEAAFVARFSERPKDSLGLCIWVGQSQGWDAGRAYERNRWRKIVERIAELHSGPVWAALLGVAEMLDRNVAHVTVRTNR